MVCRKPGEGGVKEALSLHAVCPGSTAGLALAATPACRRLSFSNAVGTELAIQERVVSIKRRRHAAPEKTAFFLASTGPPGGFSRSQRQRRHADQKVSCYSHIPLSIVRGRAWSSWSAMVETSTRPIQTFSSSPNSPRSYKGLAKCSVWGTRWRNGIQHCALGRHVTSGPRVTRSANLLFLGTDPPRLSPLCVPPLCWEVQSTMRDAPTWRVPAVSAGQAEFLQDGQTTTIPVRTLKSPSMIVNPSCFFFAFSPDLHHGRVGPFAYLRS